MREITPQKIKVKVYETKPPRIDIKAHPNLNKIELGYVEGFFGGGGKIASISVNGVPQEIDEEKNVDLFVPYKTSELDNDLGFITDSYYTAGAGISIDNGTIGIAFNVIDCGTSTTVI